MTLKRIAQWKKEIRVLDGGFGSECEKRSRLPIDGHKAWSSRLLKEDPNLVCEIHKSFLRSGCDVISTNTYQASPRTLSEALDISIAEAKELMRHAVRLARRAVDAVIEEESLAASPYGRKLPILIAGSLGSYGACLADGSEYSGDYSKNMTFSDLVEFHQTRAELLLEAGVDLLAWETIPLRCEVSAICEVMRRLPNAVGWISIISMDGQTSAAGDPLHEIALEVDKCDRLFAIGVNCSIPHHLIPQALANLSGIYDSCEPGNEDGFHPPPCAKRPGGHSNRPNVPHSRKILLVYANSGERWVPAKSKKSKFRGYWIWPPKTGPNLWARAMSRFAMRRGVHIPNSTTSAFHTKKDEQSPVKAQWVGGCCRVGPEQLVQLAEWMKPDEIYKPRSSSELSEHDTILESSTYARRKLSSTSNSVRRKATIANCGDHIKRLRSGLSYSRKTL
ncbi:Homocysteine S-methyltransferase [Fasciola hepatica]|uniref:Homocysteine S-methyltransferase n=1 Tax=Fasciola hepatica TaxID=6192 RepID=A0A2H1C2E3_FASHE|nr:Homocysteine S-methyltransferase [Fasciola hepatica]